MRKYTLLQYCYTTQDHMIMYKPVQKRIHGYIYCPLISGSKFKKKAKLIWFEKSTARNSIFITKPFSYSYSFLCTPVSYIYTYCKYINWAFNTSPKNYAKYIHERLPDSICTGTQISLLTIIHIYIHVQKMWELEISNTNTYININEKILNRFVKQLR